MAGQPAPSAKASGGWEGTAMGRRIIEFSLTKYGQQQVEQNIRLAYALANKYRAPYGVSQDDWYAECLDVLCQAVAWFSPARGTTLSSLLDRLIFLRRSNLNEVWKAKRSDRDLRAISLDELRGGEDATLLEAIGNNDPAFQQVETKELAAMVLECCSETVQKILKMAASGMSFPEIGQSLGFSKQYACQALKTERGKLVQLFPFLIGDSASPCPECGEPMVRCTTTSNPKRCAKCAAIETRKAKLLSWKKKSHRRRKGNKNVRNSA